MNCKSGSRIVKIRERNFFFQRKFFFQVGFLYLSVKLFFKNIFLIFICKINFPWMKKNINKYLYSSKKLFSWNEKNFLSSLQKLISKNKLLVFIQKIILCKYKKELLCYLKKILSSNEKKIYYFLQMKKKYFIQKC